MTDDHKQQGGTMRIRKIRGVSIGLVIALVGFALGLTTISEGATTESVSLRPGQSVTVTCSGGTLQGTWSTPLVANCAANTTTTVPPSTTTTPPALPPRPRQLPVLRPRPAPVLRPRPAPVLQRPLPLRRHQLPSFRPTTQAPLTGTPPASVVASPTKCSLTTPGSATLSFS